MKRFLTFSSALFAACLMTTQLLGQCTADFDFGDATLGKFPTPSWANTEPVWWARATRTSCTFCCPNSSLKLTSTSFRPPLRSTVSPSVVLVDLERHLIHHDFGRRGLQVNCNNGDLATSLLFLGRQPVLCLAYGHTLLRACRTAWTSTSRVVAQPSFSQEEVWIFILDLGELGCTNEEAINYNPNAVVDDGSCLLDTCLGDVDGDNSVTVSDLLEILAEFVAQKVHDRHQWRWFHNRGRFACC